MSVHRGVPGPGGVWFGGEVPGPGGGGVLVLGVSGPGGGVPGPGEVWWRPPWTATAVGGTHPTGMHSCYQQFFFNLCQRKSEIQEERTI